MARPPPPCFCPAAPVLLRAPRRICSARRPRARPRAPPPRAVFEPVPDNTVPASGPPDDEGAGFLTRLELRLRADISHDDATAIILEFARAANAEPGVLRCDVLREPGRDAFGVWVFFEGRVARAAHERSAHAARLRLLLRRRDGADNAASLVALAETAVLNRPVWPAERTAWKAALDYGTAGDGARAAAPEISAQKDFAAPLRERLNLLVANVALGDALVVVATACVSRKSYLADAQTVCVRYANDLVDMEDGEGESVVRAAVLDTPGRSREITVVMVHDRGVCDDPRFDERVAAELLDENGWSMTSSVSVFPDLSGWRVVEEDLSGSSPPGGMSSDGTRLPDGVSENFIRVGDAFKEQEERAAKARAAKNVRAGVSAAGESASDEDGEVENGNDEEEEDDREHFGWRPTGWNPKTKKVEKVDVIPPEGDDGDVRDKDGKTMQEAIMETMSGQQLMGAAAKPAQEMQAIHGSGAFKDIEDHLRKLCGKSPNALMRVVVVTGWNEARMHPFIMELDAGLDAERVELHTCVNVFGAWATLARIAAGVSTARRFEPDVIVGFGGGAVMDAAKAISALLPFEPSRVGAALASVRGDVESGRTMSSLKLDKPALPLMLVANTVGSGAELAEGAVLCADIGDDEDMYRRVLVSFPRDIPQGRISISDPRLVIPRRLRSADAAKGGLQALCFAIDVLLCPSAPKQALKLASRAIVVGKDAVLQSRREPASSDGPARDALMDMSTYAGLAREAAGGLGIATSISLALLDGVDLEICGYDAPLRVVLPRVTAAALAELATMVGEGPCLAAAIALENTEATARDLSEHLLTLAEDIGVPLVADFGVVDVDADRVIASVLKGGVVSDSADRRLVSDSAVRRVLSATLEQELDL